MKDSASRLALAGLTLAAFASRVYRLDYQSLWRDEVDAVIFATRDLGAILAMFTKVGENGPLYFLGLHAWIELAGRSEFAIRFPSVFFSVLAVLLTYHLGRRLVGARIAWIAALLLVVSPYHIWYGQEAKMYALISFLAPLSLYMETRAVQGGSRWLWLAWALLMAAFLYIHFFATLVVLVALVWLPLLVRRWPRVTPTIAIALGLLMLTALPVARWLIPALLTPAETGYYRYSFSQMVVILLYNFSMGLRPAYGVWPIALFAVLLAVGVLPILIGQRGVGNQSSRWPSARSVLLLVLYLSVPLVATWFVSLWRPVFTDRYLIISLPAFFLLMATGIQVTARGLGRVVWPESPSGPAEDTPAARSRQRKVAATRVGQSLLSASAGTGDMPRGQQRLPPGRSDVLERWAVAGLIGLVIVASLPFVWAQTHHPYKADFRAAARYIEERAGDDDVYVFLMPYVQRAFSYYHPRPVLMVEPPYTRGMSQAQVDAQMATLMAGKRRVWLFLSEPEFWDPGGLVPAWFDRHGVRQCRQEFAYIEVRCYELR